MTEGASRSGARVIGKSDACGTPHRQAPGLDKRCLKEQNWNMLDATRTLLPELRERVRRIERSPAMAHGVLPFGVAAIDRALPGGGLARGALHEILGAGGDEEDGALAAAFAAQILGRLTRPPTSPSLSPLGGGEGRGEVGVVLWCLPRRDLSGPGIAAHGLDPGRVVLVRASRDAEILWAMEE